MSESSKCLAQIAANVQIGKIRRHIFLCADQTEPHCAGQAQVPCVILRAPRYAGDSVEKGNLVKIRDCPAAVIGNEHCIMALTESGWEAAASRH